MWVGLRAFSPALPSVRRFFHALRIPSTRIAAALLWKRLHVLLVNDAAFGGAKGRHLVVGPS
jgi:hypothetical protein